MKTNLTIMFIFFLFSCGGDNATNPATYGLEKLVPFISTTVVILFSVQVQCPAGTPYPGAHIDIDIGNV